jgi:hypothetical protein
VCASSPVRPRSSPRTRGVARARRAILRVPRERVNRLVRAPGRRTRDPRPRPPGTVRESRVLPDHLGPLVEPFSRASAGNGRGERIQPDTPSPILVLPPGERPGPRPPPRSPWREKLREVGHSARHCGGTRGVTSLAMPSPNAEVSVRSRLRALPTAPEIQMASPLPMTGWASTLPGQAGGSVGCPPAEPVGTAVPVEHAASRVAMASLATCPEPSEAFPFAHSRRMQPSSSRVAARSRSRGPRSQD